MKFIFVTAILSLSLSALAQTYITNVTVTDVENQKLLANRTVIVNNGLITGMQASKIKIPENVTVIDGTGKFLIPGLTDAHIHFFQNGGLYTRPDVIDLRKIMTHENELKLAHETMEDKLKRYLQQGITSIIDVGASNNFLSQRKLFKGRADVPSIYMTGPLLTTYEPAIYANMGDETPFSLVKTIEEGIKMVRQQLPYSPDFIKIWYIAGADGLDVEKSAKNNLPVIKAIIDEAHQQHLRVAVHATQRITAELAVMAGADFLVHSIDDEVIKDDFVRLLKKNKTVLCPTLLVESGYLNTFAQKLEIDYHELRFADPFQLGTLLDLKHLPDTALINRYKKGTTSPAAIASLEKSWNTSIQNLKKLSDAGVIIAAGTDAGNIGTLHASSYLGELFAMQKAGMSNWQIIQASTINAAKAVGKENELGSISPGKKANLVLLNANPVDSLISLSNIYRVINNGLVIDPDTLVSDSPEVLVQRQLNAYNFRNMDAFLEPYADDVELYEFPNKLLGKGKEQMRTDYSKLFAAVPDLHCQILGRTVKGNIVIDHERVRVGGKYFESMVTYQIENAKIKRVLFTELPGR